MQLNIPEGAQVQIIIGDRSPMLALPDETRFALAGPVRRRRPILTTIAAGVLAVGAYQIGKHSGSGLNVLPVTQAVASTELPGFALGQASGPAAPLTGDSSQVPSAFTQQLRQPPTVVPPPGQAKMAGDTDAFGLRR